VKITVVLLALAAAILPVPRRVVETTYSQGLYLSVQPFVTGWSNTVGFALLDPLVVAAGVALCVTSIAAWRRAGRGRRARGVISVLGQLSVLAAAAYLAFLGCWGLNYRRLPLAERLDYRHDRISEPALEQLALQAVDQLNALHGRAHGRPWPETNALVKAMQPAFEERQRQLGFERLALAGMPKRTVFGFYFRWASVAGMTNPYCLEVLLTPDALGFERPALLAHEWGHLAGFAHESEAGFIGWLTALAAGDQPRYSAWLDLYPRVAAALSPTRRKQMSARLGDGPRRDYRAIELRLARGAVPVLHDSAWKGYEGFLRANRVSEGLASYDDVVKLVAGTRFEREWVPARRRTR